MQIVVVGEYEIEASWSGKLGWVSRDGRVLGLSPIAYDAPRLTILSPAAAIAARIARTSSPVGP